MHTNSTTNYHLPQFVQGDKPTWLGDVNGAMQDIDSAIAGVNTTASAADSKADSAITTANAASGTASDAATLANTANTNALSALTTAGAAATAAEAAGTAATAAGTKADAADAKATANATSIGDLTTLTTTAKTDLVAAINEVNAKPSGGGDADDITYDNTTSGLVATNVQAAIDELVTMVRPDGDAYEFINDGNGSVVIKKNGATIATLTTSASSYQDALITAHWTGSTDPWLIDAHAACTVDGVSYAANANVFSMPYAQARTYTGVFKAV